MTRLGAGSARPPGAKEKGFRAQAVAGLRLMPKRYAGPTVSHTTRKLSCADNTILTHRRVQYPARPGAQWGRMERLSSHYSRARTLDAQNGDGLKLRSQHIFSKQTEPNIGRIRRKFRSNRTIIQDNFSPNEPNNPNKTKRRARNRTRGNPGLTPHPGRLAPSLQPPVAILEFHAQSSICALADGLSAHRQRAHFHLQLALCPPQWRHNDPPHRRYRSRAQHRTNPSSRSSKAWPGWASIGMSSTGNPTVSRCTKRSPNEILAKAWPIAISRRSNRRTLKKRTRRRMALQPRPARNSARRKRPPRRRRAKNS